MSSNQYIEDRLLRHQIRIIRLSKGLSNDIKKMLKKLARSISKQVNAEPLTPNRIVSLQESIRRGIRELELNRIIIQDVEEFVKLEIEYMESLLSQSIENTTIRQTATESIFATITEKPIQLVPYKVGEPQPTFTISQAIERFTEKTNTSATLILRSGFSEGEPTKVTASKLNKLVETRTRHQAEALTRTIYNHMGTEARSYVVNANRDIFDNEEFVATLDSRTTITCAGYDGTRYEIGKGPIPPLHWSCRSLRAPRVKEEYRIPGLEGDRPAVSLNKDKTRKIKTVSAETKYSGWLRRQPKHFQEEVLGAKRAKLFRQGKIKLENFTDQQGTVIKLKDLRDKNGMPVIE